MPGSCCSKKKFNYSTSIERLKESQESNTFKKQCSYNIGPRPVLDEKATIEAGPLLSQTMTKLSKEIPEQEKSFVETNELSKKESMSINVNEEFLSVNSGSSSSIISNHAGEYENSHYMNDPRLPIFRTKVDDYVRLPNIPDELQDNFPDYPFNPSELVVPEDCTPINLNNGFTYRGETKDNCMHGIGEMTFPDGGIYRGTFFNNIPHGIGIVTTSKNTKYIGEYHKNSSHGFGCYEFEDGSKTIGHFIRNCKNGIGKEIRPSGTIFIGNYENNVRSGLGRLETKDGDFYIGNFKDGQIHGEGTYFWTDGKIYSGNWNKTQMNGKGTKWYPNGQIYHGTFANGIPNDKGILVYNDAKQAEGNFVNGQLDGKVKLFFPDGTKSYVMFTTGSTLYQNLDEQLTDSPSPVPKTPPASPLMLLRSNSKKSD